VFRDPYPYEDEYQTCRKVDRRQSLRDEVERDHSAGLTDDNGPMWISPAPGTCCPDRKIANGICEGCGTPTDDPHTNPPEVIEQEGVEGE